MQKMYRTFSHDRVFAFYNDCVFAVLLAVVTQARNERNKKKVDKQPTTVVGFNIYKRYTLLWVNDIELMET